jgi:hypothetical protein
LIAATTGFHRSLDFGPMFSPGSSKCHGVEDAPPTPGAPLAAARTSSRLSQWPIVSERSMPEVWLADAVGPTGQVIAVDRHEERIDEARRFAARFGLDDRTTFSVADVDDALRNRISRSTSSTTTPGSRRSRATSRRCSASSELAGS